MKKFSINFFFLKKSWSSHLNNITSFGLLMIVEASGGIDGGEKMEEILVSLFHFLRFLFLSLSMLFWWIKITDSTSEQATHSSLLDIFSEEKEKKRIYFHLLHFPPFFSVCMHGLHTKYPSEEKNGGKSVLCILYINYVLHLNWTELNTNFGGYIHTTYIGIVGEGEFGGRDFISWLYMKKVVESGRQRQHQSFSQKVKWKSKALKKVSKS